MTSSQVGLELRDDPGSPFPTPRIASRMVADQDELSPRELRVRKGKGVGAVGQPLRQTLHLAVTVGIESDGDLIGVDDDVGAVHGGVGVVACGDFDSGLGALHQGIQSFKEGIVGLNVTLFQLLIATNDQMLIVALDRVR